MPEECATVLLPGCIVRCVPASVPRASPWDCCAGVVQWMEEGGSTSEHSPATPAPKATGLH